MLECQKRPVPRGPPPMVARLRRAVGGADGPRRAGPDARRRRWPTSPISDKECEQRRAQDRERLKQAAERLLTSQCWQRWVRVRAQGGLARLSLNNQLLVALSQPDATFVLVARLITSDPKLTLEGHRQSEISPVDPAERYEKGH